MPCTLHQQYRMLCSPVGRVHRSGNIGVARVVSIPSDPVGKFTLPLFIDLDTASLEFLSCPSRRKIFMGSHKKHPPQFKVFCFLGLLMPVNRRRRKDFPFWQM